jgi:hypothetical protein
MYLHRQPVGHAFALTRQLFTANRLMLAVFITATPAGVLAASEKVTLHYNYIADRFNGRGAFSACVLLFSTGAFVWAHTAYR